MKKLLLLYIPLLTLALQACGGIEDEYMYGKGLYTIDWNAAADSSSTSLIARFWNADEHFFNYGNDGLVIDFQYWPQAHAMDVLIDAYIRTNDAKYKTYFDAWYAGIKVKNGNSYWNNYYDDMEWINLTMLRLYDATKEQKYLDTSKELWGYIKAGWDETYAGGGVSWVHDKPWSKNACSNGPASIIASRIYAITKDDSDKAMAIKIYDWEKENLFNPASGAIYDNINGQTGAIGQFSLSYNQGTFVGAAYELYKMTGDVTYLNDARKAANFCISNSGMIDIGNNVLRDEGNGDGGLFKGIFMRYFVQLILDKDLDPIYKTKFTTFLNNNAETLWRKGVRKQDLLFGTSWTSAPAGTTQLTSHTSGCTLIEAKAYYEKMIK